MVVRQNIRVLLAIIVLVALAQVFISGCWSSQKNVVGTISFNKELIIDEDAHSWNNAAWDQYKLITYGDYQYCLYWDADLRLVFVRRDLNTDEIQKVVFPDILSEPDDNHRNTNLGVSMKNGRIHLTYDHRSNPMNYRVSNPGFVTNPPEAISISDFSEKMSVVREHIMTYPRFFNDSMGRLYLLFRSGNDSFLYRYDDDGNNWSRIGVVLSQRGTYNGSTSRGAYENDVIFDANDRLHLTWMWREEHHRRELDHGLYYAYSDDYGVTWKNNGGELIADLAAFKPITINSPGIRVVDVPQGSWIVNSGAMALDSKNQPHVFTSRSTIITDIESKAVVARIHYWRSEDGIWHEQYIEEPPIGARAWRQRGDIAINHNDEIITFFLDDGVLWFAMASPPLWNEWKFYSAGELNAPFGDQKYDRFRWNSSGVLSIPLTERVRGSKSSTRFIIRDYVVDGIQDT